MNTYKVYTLKSNKSMIAKGKYPQEALIDLVAEKMQIGKKYIHCTKANSVSAIAHSLDYPFIVVGVNGELYFYDIKVNKEAAIRAAEVQKGLKPALVFDNENPAVVIYYNPKLKTPSAQIWNILTQLHKKGVIYRAFERKSKNCFSCSVPSAGGSDYDDPYLRITVNDRNNTMELYCENSYGKRFSETVSCNNMKALCSAIGTCEMWS